MDQLARLCAKADIEDVLLRYARGVDRRDWPAVRACFHDDATDDHGDFRGPVDEFISWVSHMHGQVPSSCHFLGNCLIEFVDHSKAVVETYFIALLRLGASSQQHRAMLTDGAGSSEEIDMDVLGRYLDHFELRSGAWRIARRTTVFDTTRMRPSQNGPLKPGWATGTRDSSDPVYAWRQQLGLLGQPA